MRPRSLLRFPALLALASLSLPTAPTLAEESNEAGTRPPAEEMIVSGSRRPQSAATIPNATTVLEGTELERSVSLSLDDALRFVPGLGVTRQGGRGGRSELYLRGLDPNHVVVLVDGVRLNDPTNSRGGSFDPTTLALLDIERVEIVRGPLSTVYGSDALAGAINVITRSGRGGEAPEASARFRGGRFGTLSGVAQARGGLGEHVGFSLGAALETFEDPNSDGGYDGASLKGKLSATLPYAIDFEAFTRIHRSSARGFPDSSGGEELAVLPNQEDRNTREILFGARVARDFGEQIHLASRIGYTTRREEVDSPGVVSIVPPASIPPSRLGDEYDRWEWSTTADIDVLDLEGMPVVESLEANFVGGVEAIWEDGESDGYLDFDFGGPGGFVPTPFFETRRTVSVFGTLEERIGDFVTVTGSLRFDSIRDENDRLSPSVGVSVGREDGPLVVYGNWGQGFKLPSFFALGNPLVGSRALRRETSRGWEVGVRARALDGRLRAQVGYFNLRVEDLIDFAFTPAPMLLNRSKLVSHGVELEVEWQPDDRLSFRVGGTYNPTRFVNDATDPTNRPRWRGFVEVTGRPIESVALSARLLGQSAIKASSATTAGRVDTLSGYERLDVRATWTPHDWIDLFLEIENLTNATPREAVGFESPGIAPRVGVTLRM